MPLSRTGEAAARTLLIRGLLAGGVAGALTAGFGFLFGEGPVSAAIDYESAHAAAEAAGGHGHEAEVELVSRQVQATLGLGLAAVVLGIALGGLFGIGFALARGRLVGFGDRGLALCLAGAGFVTVHLVPFLKYPANPPAVGVGETIARRTVLYFGMVAISVLAGVLGLIVGRRLRAATGSWNATLAGVAVFVAVVAAAAAGLPGVDEVPADFPASLLWRFRIASLGSQLVLWTALGLGFGALCARAQARAGARAARAGAVSVAGTSDVATVE